MIRFAVFWDENIVVISKICLMSTISIITWVRETFIIFNNHLDRILEMFVFFPSPSDFLFLINLFFFVLILGCFVPWISIYFIYLSLFAVRRLSNCKALCNQFCGTGAEREVIFLT